MESLWIRILYSSLEQQLIQSFWAWNFDVSLEREQSIYFYLSNIAAEPYVGCVTGCLIYPLTFGNKQTSFFRQRSSSQKTRRSKNGMFKLSNFCKFWEQIAHYT